MYHGQKCFNLSSRGLDGKRHTENENGPISYARYINIWRVLRTTLLPLGTFLITFKSNMSFVFCVFLCAQAHNEEVKVPNTQSIIKARGRVLKIAAEWKEAGNTRELRMHSTG